MLLATRSTELNYPNSRQEWKEKKVLCVYARLYCTLVSKEHQRRREIKKKINYLKHY